MQYKRISKHLGNGTQYLVHGAWKSSILYSINIHIKVYDENKSFIEMSEMMSYKK